MLSGPEIRRQLALGNIVIDPWDGAHVNPNSYDLTLAGEIGELVIPWQSIQGHQFRLLDMRQPPEVRLQAIGANGIVLQPGRLYLASSAEYTESRGLVPQINGKSTPGRYGICIHQTAGFGDDGFCGTWTLELTVAHPVRIYAGMRIAQLCWFPLEGERQSYNGKYQNQRGPTGARSDGTGHASRPSSIGSQSRDRAGAGDPHSQRHEDPGEALPGRRHG